MSKIQWTQAMSTGVAEIDSQHQELIEQIQLLDNELDQPHHEIDIERVLDLIDFLDNYARHHFDDEQRQMEVFNCEYKDQNIKEHKMYIEALADFSHRLSGEGVSRDLVEEMREKLDHWVQHHIAEVDTKLFQSVNAHTTNTIGSA